MKGSRVLFAFILFFFCLHINVSQSNAARYAAIVIDANNGAVLHAVNPDKRRYPASLTKIMTLYMVFEAHKRGDLTLDQRLRVSRRAAGMAPTNLRLKAGTYITVKSVIFSLITKSANDAAVIVAEAIGKTEIKFAEMMTKKARQMGMRKTTFRNASGLPNRRQRTTARDMATLAVRLITDFPKRYRYFSTQKFKFRGKTLKNHNNLLRTYRGVDGVKTGYIRASGFNLVASAERDGHRLIGVVFGGRSAKTRDKEMARLLDKGFKKTQNRIARNARSRNAKLRTTSNHKPIKKAGLTLNANGKTAKAAKLESPKTKLKIPKTKAPNPVAKAPALRSIPATSPMWSIQVGAYRQANPARRAANLAVKRIRNLPKMTRIHITPHQQGENLFYRARLVGFTKTRAEAACRRLRSRQMGCVPIPPA
ncbi:MAG: D-alanyl-D-alanine carboxypeptidase [Alphaproteobacteria bacterium]|nr:D-alanyl-D-alanine carboxypeptidase [Alphaproteobacteria bacterium]